MRTIGLAISGGEGGRESGLIRVAKPRAKRLINRAGVAAPNFQHADESRPMTSADFNRTALALLGSILFAMLLVAFSNLVFAPERPAVPGYNLPSSAGPEKAPAAAAAPQAAPLPELLAKADAKKGEQDAKICATCHNFEKGQGAKIGPNLWDVVGRPIGSFPGFAYSDSLEENRRRLDL